MRRTLTMVMSRISMNDAVAIAAVRNKSLPPCRGGYSNAAAGLAGSAMGDSASGAEIAIHDGIGLGVGFVEILGIHLGITDRRVGRTRRQHRPVASRRIHRHGGG